MIALRWMTALLITLMIAFTSNSVLAQENNQALHSAPDEELLEIRALFDSESEVMGRFIQTKKIHNFQFPIISSGSFEIINNDHLKWIVEQPIQSTIIINESGLHIATQKDSTAATSRENEARPQTSVITAIVRALLSMDTPTLSEHFSIKVINPAPKWQLELTPKNTVVANTIRKIALTGEKSLGEITLEETRGDTTSIRFESGQEQP